MLVQALIDIGGCFLRNGCQNPEDLVVSYKFSLPWNQSKLVGRIAVIFLGILSPEAFNAINSSHLSFFMATAVVFKAFHEFFGLTLAEIDTLDATELKKRDGKAKRLLTEAVEFHNQVKE